MPTDCSTELFEFAPVAGRKVVADFDGGAITSDAGALLLGQADRALGLIKRFAQCFTDTRRPELIEHSVATLVGQRVHGLALGYEDLNDHDQLRHDPVFGLLAGKLTAGREDCAAVAGKSTLNRLERSKPEPSRYHKISYEAAAIEALFVDVFLDAHKKAPEEIILDLDATDDPLHGEQEGRFFHGYYKNYCYLPLYIFCGRHLLVAKLRVASVDAADGVVEEVARIIQRIRARWPKVRIVLRADSGFTRDDLMSRSRSQRSRLSLRPGPEPAAGQRDRRRDRRSRRGEPENRPVGAPLQGLYIQDQGQLEPRAAGCRQGGMDASHAGRDRREGGDREPEGAQEESRGEKTQAGRCPGQPGTGPSGAGPAGRASPAGRPLQSAFHRHLADC